MKRLFAVLSAIAISVLTTGNVNAQDFDEGTVKASYVYNFVKFMRWTEISDTTICLAPGISHEEHLMKLAGAKIGEHAAIVKRIFQGRTFSGCRIVVFPPNADAHDIRQAAKSGSVTIGEGDNFISDGGAISLIKIDGKIKFDVSISNLQSINVEMSAHALKLARNAYR